MEILRFLTVLSAILLVACGLEPPSLPTMIGTNVWPGYEPLYLARELDMLDRDQVKLIEYPSSSEVIRSFRNGNLDAAALTLDEVLLLLQSNIPVKVVLVMDISDGADVVLAQPDIKTFNDLKNKTVGVESSALGAYVISRALELNGLSLDEVKIKNVAVRDHEKAFVSRRVDAVVTFEPVRTSLLKQGANEIFSSKQMPDEIVDVLVVNDDYLKQQPEHVRQLISVWFETLQFMQTQRHMAMQIIAKRMMVSAEDTEASYQGLRLAGLEENRRLLSGEKPKLREGLKQLKQVMLTNKLLNREVDISALLTDEMLGQE